MAENLTRITLYPAPHVELRIYATEQMIEKLKKCGKNELLCTNCEWKDVVFNDTRICLTKELGRWLKEHG